MIEEIREYGYLLESENGKIISMKTAGKKIELNQVVISNGRIFFPKGTKGVVKKIVIPFTEGHTSDVIEVLFEGATITKFMKPKDLEL